MKKCPKCDRSKPLTEFNRAKRGAHGRQRYCRACQSKYYQASREKRIAQAAESKRRLIGRKYGLTLDEVSELRASNGGMCHICNVKPGTAIDHDHLTGRVRGHLCTGCNTALGKLGDSVEGLQRAINYLLK